MQPPLPRRLRGSSDRSTALERRYRDLQDIEFTVEHGRLYLLQTRSAKRRPPRRSGSVAMVEGALDRDDAIGGSTRRRSTTSCTMIAPGARYDVVRGPRRVAGRGVGTLSSTPTRPEARGARGEDVILVRWETSPDDIHGLIAARAS